MLNGSFLCYWGCVAVDLSAILITYVLSSVFHALLHQAHTSDPLFARLFELGDSAQGVNMHFVYDFLLRFACIGLLSQALEPLEFGVFGSEIDYLSS